MNAGKFVAYMALWSLGYIAVHAIVLRPMKSLENTLAGTKEA